MADEAGVARIVVLGRSVRRVPVVPGTTLGALLEGADIDAGGRDLHVNGRAADLDTPVLPGDLVTVIPRVRGGMHLCTIKRLRRPRPEAATRVSASVSIDPELCIGSGDCVRLVPAAFELREDLGVSVPRPGAGEAGEALLVEAAVGCPTQAIRVMAADGTVLHAGNTA